MPGCWASEGGQSAEDAQEKMLGTFGHLGHLRQWRRDVHSLHPSSVLTKPTNPFGGLEPHAPRSRRTVRGESFRHQERREGPDPMTARQPGEAAKVPRSARKRGRCGERQRNQRLPSSISLQHRTPIGGIFSGQNSKEDGTAV